MKNIFKVMVFTLFMAFLILPSVIWGVLTLSSSDIVTSSSIEMTENRKPAEMPKKINLKTITSDLEAYYNDRLPFRHRIITSKNSFFDTIEKPYNDSIQPFLIELFHPSETTDDNQVDDFEDEATTDNDSTKCNHDGVVLEKVDATYEKSGYTLYRCSKCSAEYKDNFVKKLVDSNYMPPRLFNELVIEGRHNWLFYAGDNSIEYYKGTNVLSTKVMGEWLATMNKLQKICDEKNIELRFLILPNKEQVYSEFMPSYTVSTEKKRVPVFVDYVKANSDIGILYPLNELKAGKKDWQVYYKHDTHWNGAGSFIAVQQLYRSLGMPTTDLNSIVVTEKNVETGDLIKIGSLSASSYNIDTGYNVEYKRDIKSLSEDTSVKEALFATSTSPNEKNFVMIGDSFRNSMWQYVKRDFSSCSVFHRNVINNEKSRSAIKQADVLVIEVLERYDSSLPGTINKCISILSEE